MGYRQAGFDVVGVDLKRQAHYPFDFHQADALTFPTDGFDAIHASPPCQRWSKATGTRGKPLDHPDFVATIRARLIDSGVPFVIENVPKAPLREDLLLCGSMFDLRVVRHRIFESNVPLPQPAHGTHHADYVTVAGHTGGSSKRDGAIGFGSTDDWREAMGIGWMVGRELAEAIPPAYTEFIGRQLMEHLEYGNSLYDERV